MGVETKMVSENPRDANAMQIPRHRYYVSVEEALARGTKIRRIVF